MTYDFCPTGVAQHHLKLKTEAPVLAFESYCIQKFWMGTFRRQEIYKKIYVSLFDNWKKKGFQDVCIA